MNETEHRVVAVVRSYVDKFYLLIGLAPVHLLPAFFNRVSLLLRIRALCIRAARRSELCFFLLQLRAT